MSLKTIHIPSNGFQGFLPAVIVGILLKISLFIPIFAQPQPKFSAYGDIHTPSGRLHILWIFVRFEDKCINGRTPEWIDTTAEGFLPKMAAGGEVNLLLDANPETLSQPNHIRNISDYYYQNSYGKFLLTGDIFPCQVPVKYIPDNASNFFARQGQMNEAAVKWITEHYPNFDWAKYDRRKNSPRFVYDNHHSQPDSVLDYVVFLYRDAGGTGMGSSGSFKVPGTPYSLTAGHTGIKCYWDDAHNWEYFKHEFSHNLFSCPHYMGANGASGDKFYLNQGWGLMSNTCVPFMTANAWEKWWLGWMQPQEVTINGTYKLKDLTAGNDAIRIHIPGTQDFLWIENHQKINHWDNKLFFNGKSTLAPVQVEYPEVAKGLYLFVSAEPGADRNKPTLSPFNPKHANLFKMYNGEGNSDYVFTGDTIKGDYFDCPVWRKAANNPFAGQNDFQAIRYDLLKNGNLGYREMHGNLDAKAGQQYLVNALQYEGKNIYGMNMLGDELDAFDIGDEIGLSGIVPVVNYPTYLLKDEKLNPFIINGITIKILSIDEAGTYTLDIRFDDYTLRKSQRWCGNLWLPAAELSAPRVLALQKNTVLTLDLSGTADRNTAHPLTNTFANPTNLKVDAQNTIRIEKGAKMIMDKHSRLELNGNAFMVVESGGELRVNEGAEIVMNSGTRILVKKGGKMTVSPNARFKQLEGSYLGTEKGSKVKM